jgi:hypothetical protein
MTESSDEQARKELREALAQEQATGEPVDDSWTNDLPSDPLPEDDEDVSATFVKKHT